MYKQGCHGSPGCISQLLPAGHLDLEVYVKLTWEINQTLHFPPHDFCVFWLFCFLIVTSILLGDLVLSESLVPPGSYLSQIVSSFLSEQTYTWPSVPFPWFSVLIQDEVQQQQKIPPQAFECVANFTGWDDQRDFYRHANGLIQNLMLDILVHKSPLAILSWGISPWLHFPVDSCSDGHLASSLHLWTLLTSYQAMFPGLASHLGCSGAGKMPPSVFQSSSSFYAFPSPQPT